jgi:hypothetical protein
MESRKEQGFYTFFMYTELTLQEGLSFCQYVPVWLTSTVLKISIIPIMRFSKQCNWEFGLKILKMEAVRSFETSELVYSVM